MTNRTCCVTGHRDIPENQTDFVKRELRREIEEAIAQGYTQFISGFAEGADQYFAEIVLEKRRENDVIHLEAAIPYRSRAVRLLKDEKTKWMLEGCTELRIISKEYSPGVFMQRNRYMVDLSDSVIAVHDGRENGGTAATIRMAYINKKEVRVISIV